MLLRNKQQGFAVLEALLILIVLGILGFTGWFVYHSKQATDKTLASTGNSSVGTSKVPVSSKTSTKPVPPSSQTYLAITEWGVKLQTSSSDQIIYMKDSASQSDSMVFTTKKAEAIGGYCTLAKDGLGTVTRYAQAQTFTASPPESLNSGKPINGYYYYFSHPQSQCALHESDFSTIAAESKVVSAATETIQVQ